MYHGHIAVKDLSDNSDDEGIDKTPEPDLHELIEAHVLGLKLKSSMFYRGVLEALLESTEETRIYPDKSDVRLVYDNTTKGAIIRLVLVRMYAQAAQGHWLRDEESIGYSRRFLRDLTIALLEKGPWERRWDLAEMRDKYVIGKMIGYGRKDGAEPEEMNNLSEELSSESESGEDEEMLS